MKRIYEWALTGLIGVLLFTSGVLFTDAVANKESSGINAVTVLPELKSTYERATAQANLPVLVPTEVPSMDQFWLTESVGDDGNRYTLFIDSTADCNGTGACDRGAIGGEIITANTEPVEEIYSFINEPPVDPNRPRSDDPMGTVELMNGVEGFFIPWEATAQCSMARVYWEQPSISSDETYRYYVGIECGDRAEVIELANSVIANTEGF
jgi:hypothetical protein